MPQSSESSRSVAMTPGSATDEAYTLPVLRYGYADLEPVIDRQTMEIHYTKHHRAYVDALNAALAKYPQWRALPIDELLARAAELPEDIRTSVLNQGGGHANHSLFWQCLTAQQGGAPDGELAAAISRSFGSLANFKSAFEAAGVRHFASGWVTLAADPQREWQLSITTLPNHGTLNGTGKSSILICDLWEHAYYLKHQNRRAEWLSTWWSVVDWAAALERFTDLKKRQVLVAVPSSRRDTP